jgi:hypothetical protein
MRFRTSSSGILLAAALAMGAAWVTLPTIWLAAQAPQVKTGGSTFYEREAGRNRARFQGDASQQPDGLVLLKKFRMETLSEREEPEMTIAAPECLFNVVTRSAWSSGALKVSRADGLFTLEGEGFHWDQKETRLAISNKVRAVIRRNLFAQSTNSTPR